MPELDLYLIENYKKVLIKILYPVAYHLIKTQYIFLLNDKNIRYLLMILIVRNSIREKKSIFALMRFSMKILIIE